MGYPSFHATAQGDLNPAPSRDAADTTKVGVATSVPKGASGVAVTVGVEGAVPPELGVGRDGLRAAGFEGKAGQTLAIPRDGATLIAVGIGEPAKLSAAVLRDAGAALGRAGARHGHLAAMVPNTNGVAAVEAAQSLVEGALLARYRYTPLRHIPEHEPPLRELTLVSAGPLGEIEAGAARGAIVAHAARFARDLANAPATLLTARKMAEIAQAIAQDTGLEIEILDEHALLGLGCGGLLGVNAGSAEPPRLIKLTYRPKQAGGHVEPNGRVNLVGKGIMYDSGGISLKPNDLVHATMKVDMSGAAAILASMSTLSALDCKAEVTGYLMCTDNMPGGAAMKLGDVLTIRGGKTVEVLNTDAEGRLVLADGLMLSTEQTPRPDAIVDIATLTGACQRALGKLSAGVIGNQAWLVEQLKTAAQRTDETVWELPLDRRYREELDSEIADLKNVGGVDAGAITAALFLEEFVGDLPWAHLDIAGTAQFDKDDSWRCKGATGFGTRLLIEFLLGFGPPRETLH